MSSGVLDLRVAAPQREHDASRIEKTYLVLAGRFGFHKAKALVEARGSRHVGNAKGDEGDVGQEELTFDLGEVGDGQRRGADAVQQA